MKRIALLVAVALAGCSAEPTPPCEDEVAAFVMAQGFIKDALKAPSSADFPMLASGEATSTPVKLQDGRCAFTVRTPVDAENSFGAMIREQFTVTLAPDPASKGVWELVDLKAG